LALTDKVKVALVDFELELVAAASADAPSDNGSMKITARSEYLRRFEDIEPPWL
jgi:hypothetical protein